MLRRCTECKVRYGFGPKCELCLEREVWAEVDRGEWKFWLGVGIGLLYAVTVAVLIPWLFLRAGR